MKPSVKLVACLLAALCALGFGQFASAQAQGDATSAASTSPSAYVYLINATSTKTTELDGYSADSNGSLTLLPGSPFWVFKSQYTGGIAHTAHWLFASDGTFIYSFSIAANGSLKEVSSVNAEQYAECPGCGSITALFLDHTGSTLYALSFYDDSSNNAIQFWQKNNTTGGLSYFGSSSEGIVAGRLAFIGNNEYGYSAGCPQQYGGWYSVHRDSDGSLVWFSQQPPAPDNLCPWGTQTADRSNNLAVALIGEDNPQFPAHLAVYTADSSGNLTTNSTEANMPTAAVGDPDPLSLSPAANLLAVGGDKGLQIFHFNGSNPITPYTGLIAAHSIQDLAWDSNNHLFAIGSGRVNAFRVTSTGYKQAPGSPYAINAIALTVLSLSGSTACAPPSTAGVNICSPANGSTDSSPVSVSAAATASSGLHITATRLYVDAKSVYTSTSNTLSTSVSLSAGSHRLDVVGYESNGSAEKASETITVK